LNMEAEMAGVDTDFIIESIIRQVAEDPRG
jgi:hypothetical protein